MDTLKNIQIEARSLGKRFGRLKVFSGVTFSAETGDSLALTGPNGSGKSTLLEIACGLQEPSAGAVMSTIDGAPVPPAALIALAGVASPRCNPYNELTGVENIDFVLRSRGARGASTVGLVERFGLDGHIRRQVRQYSTGMKQRLKLILAALLDPPLLILDEPGSNLDEDGRERFFNYIEEVRQRKLIIIATNDPAEESLCRGKVRLV